MTTPFTTDHNPNKEPLRFVTDIVRYTEKTKLRGPEKLKLALEMIGGFVRLTQDLRPIWEGLIEDALRMKLQIERSGCCGNK